MKFTLPPTADADLLSTEVDYFPEPLSVRPAMSCQLFERDQLLGTDASCAGHWQSAAAAVRLPGTPLVDFSTFAAGTTTARVEYVVSSGSWVFDGGGAVSLGRTTMTATGPDVTYVAAGTASPLELISSSCR